VTLFLKNARFLGSRDRNFSYEQRGDLKVKDSLRGGSRWSTSARGVAASAKTSGEAARRESELTFLTPLHQTPSRRIALLLAARAHDSKVKENPEDVKNSKKRNLVHVFLFVRMPYQKIETGSKWKEMLVAMLKGAFWEFSLAR